jgi:hypothetical protein
MVLEAFPPTVYWGWGSLKADRLRQIESQATALRAERRSYYAGLMAAADWRLAMARTRPGDKPPLAGAVSMALRVVASLLRSLSLLPLPR